METDERNKNPPVSCRFRVFRVTLLEGGGTGYWMLDTGYWILDTGYWMLTFLNMMHHGRKIVGSAIARCFETGRPFTELLTLSV